MAKEQRILAVKIDIDWKTDQGKHLYNRLRDLAWQAAHYRNSMVRRQWAASQGWRVDPEAKDKNDVLKQGRKQDKGELSGDVYSCCESEVMAAWARDCRKILAGQPLPEWRTNAALSITGKEKYQDSGIQLHFRDGQYVLRLRAQGRGYADGCWLDLPVAKNTARDEYQGPVLMRMVSWDTPIKKVTIQIKRSKIIARLTYAIETPAQRNGQCATLGPVNQEGRLLLRTERQTKDYTSKFAEVTRKKDAWDGIRRRVLCQIGRRKGQARIKRERLSHLSWDNWLHSFLHEWTRDAITWCESQDVNEIRIAPINTGDWPAHIFIEQLRYKASSAGITVAEGIAGDAGAERAVKAVIGKAQRKVRRRNEALRELDHQLKRGA